MVSPAPLYDGFLPGRHGVSAFGQGGFRFAGISHQGSIMALPSGIHAFEAPVPFSHSVELYARVLAEAAEIDLLLIGTGLMPVALPETLRWRLRDARISADVMTTASACSTFAVLLGEGRRAAAVLAAVD
jgi:uncharacterized protein